MKKERIYNDKINIIGMGELGKELYDKFTKHNKSVYGTDINEQRIKELYKQGYNIGKNIQSDANVYVVAVYTTEQVLDNLDEIIKEDGILTKPLISIESTIKPGTSDMIRRMVDGENLDVAIFPHRYNPNDSKHHLFNLDRLLAGITENGEYRARKFYEQFMPAELIHTYPTEIVELAKSAENAYRYMEIVVAQHIRDICEDKGLEFDVLREAMNTKWNIDVMEARDGCGGKCLPKDSKIFADYFNSNLFKLLRVMNKDYEGRRKKK